MGWLVALAIIILLLILPIGVSLLYSADGLLLYARVGVFRLKLFPLKKKEKKKVKQKKTAQPAQTKKKAAAKNSGGSIVDFIPLARTLFDFLRDFKAKLRVNELELKIVLAGGDPGDLAVNYGRTWAAVGNLLPLLDQFMIVLRRDINVSCDFTSDKTQVTARIDLTITLFRLLSLGIYYGIRVLREYMNIMNQRKGGAKI